MTGTDGAQPGRIRHGRRSAGERERAEHRQTDGEQRKPEVGKSVRVMRASDGFVIHYKGRATTGTVI